MIGLLCWNWSTLYVKNKTKKQLRLIAYYHLYFTLFQVLIGQLENHTSENIWISCSFYFICNLKSSQQTLQQHNMIFMSYWSNLSCTSHLSYTSIYCLPSLSQIISLSWHLCEFIIFLNTGPKIMSKNTTRSI